MSLLLARRRAEHRLRNAFLQAEALSERWGADPWNDVLAEDFRNATVEVDDAISWAQEFGVEPGLLAR